MTDLRKLRAGLYDTGILHVGCQPLPERVAGGPIQIERVGRHWEAVCPSCLLSDPDEYDTLREAAAETANRWKERF